MQVGGVPAVLKYLLQKGLLHGDCLTVTGAALCIGCLASAVILHLTDIAYHNLLGCSYFNII